MVEQDDVERVRESIIHGLIPIEQNLRDNFPMFKTIEVLVGSHQNTPLNVYCILNIKFTEDELDLSSWITCSESWLSESQTKSKLNEVVNNTVASALDDLMWGFRVREKYRRAMILKNSITIFNSISAN